MQPPHVDSPPGPLIDQTLNTLITSAISTATRRAYLLALLEIQRSLIEDTAMADLRSPASTIQILQFITRLHLKGLSASSIRSKLSAIAYWHHLHEWKNPVDNFVVRKALVGVSNLAPPISPRKGPITPALLRAIVQAIDFIGLSFYDRLLFKAIFLTAFFAFLRVSEYTQSHHNLPYDAISMLSNAVKIIFTSFKFSRNQIAEILLPAISSNLCPVAAMKAYLVHRPRHAVSFFVDELGAPIKVSRMRQVLRSLSSCLHIKQGLVKPHSFRIGAATTAAAIGLPDESIMRMGCWSSAAFCKYIHCQVNAF